MDWIKKRIGAKTDIENAIEQEELAETVAAEPAAVDTDIIVNDEPKCVDAEVLVTISKGGTIAEATVFPPENCGKDVTYEQIMQVLREKNIVFGIKETAIHEIVSKKIYDTSVVVAEGIAATDGLDGKIIDKFERERSLSFTEDERGVIDFKKLNLIHDIPEKTVICEIVQPVPPQPGKDVFGKDIFGRAGIMPTIPQGENTALSMSDTKLIAAKGGNLIYSNNRFSVQTTIDIAGNVDNSTGNIEFSNDVVVRGSLLEGYEINAAGNVTVYGVVEGAVIKSKKNINLKSGVNGMGSARIEAKGDLTCKHLENCTVNVGGKLVTESIIHSNVFSGDKVEVTMGRGCIIGGTCSALNTIDVKTIGNSKNTPITIMLGATQEMISERRDQVEEIRNLERKQESLLKDISYLEQLSDKRALTDKQEDILKERKVENIRNLMRLSTLTKRAEELEKLISGNTKCKLTFSKIYPPARIVIGNDSLQIHDEHVRGVVYYTDGAIKISV